MYIHLYKNNPTVGGTDGSQVSEGTGLNPITTNLLNSANNEESSAIKLALRCDAGYKTAGSVIIVPVGTTLNKWCLSLDGVTWGGYGAVLTVSTVVTAVNTIIYCKAKSDNSEKPTSDISVSLQIFGSLLAV